MNLTDKWGNIPLHLAYARRDAQMIALLLKHGADRNALNNAGQKPKDLLGTGEEEDTNYAKTKSLLNLCVYELFALKKDDFINKENLELVQKL